MYYVMQWAKPFPTTITLKEKSRHLFKRFDCSFFFLLFRLIPRDYKRKHSIFLSLPSPKTVYHSGMQAFRIQNYQFMTCAGRVHCYISVGKGSQDFRNIDIKNWPYTRVILTIQESKWFFFFSLIFTLFKKCRGVYLKEWPLLHPKP